MSTGFLQPGGAGLSPRHSDIFFPPPPTTATNTADNKKTINFSFKTRQSTDSASTRSSIQKQPRPILKKSITSTKRTRQWILLSLLTFSFTILILSVILAYCAALPHSDNIAKAQASSSAAAAGYTEPTTSTVSLTAAFSTSTSSPELSSYPFSPSGYNRRRRDTPTIATNDDQAIEAALAKDAINQARFSTPSAMAALTFYTATLPLLTILHTATELLASLVRPETSQSTRFGDMIRSRNAVSATTTDAATGRTIVLRRRRIGTLVSFAVSALLAAGWAVIQLFTINCEIATFGHQGQAVCPVQIRGHRMGGISGLSVGKVVLGFLVILGYIGYCVYLVRAVGVFGGRNTSSALGLGNGGRVTSGFRRRARFAAPGKAGTLVVETELANGRGAKSEPTKKKGDVAVTVVDVDGHADDTESVVIGLDHRRDPASRRNDDSEGVARMV